MKFSGGYDCGAYATKDGQIHFVWKGVEVQMTEFLVQSDAERNRLRFALEHIRSYKTYANAEAEIHELIDKVLSNERGTANE